MQKHFIFILLLMFSMESPAETPADIPGKRVYRINTGFKAPVSKIYRLIINEAFDRIDLPVDFQEVSAERSIKLANQGIDDGDCCRIEEVNRNYPNLVRIPVKVINIDFSGFSKDPTIRTDHWTDLKSYDVAVVSGWKILETGLEKHSPNRLYKVSSPQSLFSMLDKNRVHVATIGRLVGYQTIIDMGLNGIQVLEPPLVSRPLYLFLHKKNLALVNPLRVALSAMSKEGVMDKYYNEIVEPLENRIAR